MICNKCGNEAKKNTCSECGQPFCPEHLFFYVDGNNISITKNSKPHCEKCYRLKYGNK